MPLPAFLLLTLLAADKPADDKTVEQLTEQVRKSIVVVHVTGRDGERQGLGTGFVVGDGLIATNYHVVGDNRPVTVETTDGKKHDVTAIHAFDRAGDLAVVRIDAKGLPVLPLGDSAALKDGQPVVAVGNPLGLKRSVVAGVLSGQRDIEGRSMLQLAMPVERGNSGGPVVDTKGRVIGIVTSKSAIAEHLGFAAGVNELKALLAKPNTVQMSAWLTIGVLDSDDWKVELGGRWRQRAGRVLSDAPGAGFGGRTYSLWKRELPALPYEVAVTVKLDDESGAAGLIFLGDDDGHHYGFYPSGGELRLTRFDGPDVFTWKILEQKSTPHYKPGEWNTLKVRIEKDGFRCFVNDRLVVEAKDKARETGSVGLAKFRQTKAEFKQFQVAKQVANSSTSDALAARVKAAVGGLAPGTQPNADVLGKLGAEGSAGLKALRERAKRLEEEANQLKHLAAVVHRKAVQDELTKALSAPADKIDLLHAALLIARLDNDELDVDFYRRAVDQMASKLSAKLPKDADDKAKVEALNKFLFAERGFHGSRADYYTRSNSYLNEVLDDREGLPITLSVVYMELGRRLGLKIEGVGLPGHFVVRHMPKKGEPQIIDVFEGGKAMSKADAVKKIEGLTGEKPDESFFAAVEPKQIIVRMLGNLSRVAQEEKDIEAVLRYVDTVVVLKPDAASERGIRALARFQLGDPNGALEDLDWILENMPEGVDLNGVRALRQRIERSRK